MQLEDPDTPALPDLDAEGVGRRIRTAVDGLPEQQRLALVLSRFHHCSYEEVAEAMATTIPAVKSLLTRARANLRKRLADLLEGATPAPAGGSGRGSNPEPLGGFQ